MPRILTGLFLAYYRVREGRVGKGDHSFVRSDSDLLEGSRRRRREQ
jgi:hypothetical protein